MYEETIFEYGERQDQVKLKEKPFQGMKLVVLKKKKEIDRKPRKKRPK